MWGAFLFLDSVCCCRKSVSAEEQRHWTKFLVCTGRILCNSDTIARMATNMHPAPQNCCSENECSDRCNRSPLRAETKVTCQVVLQVVLQGVLRKVQRAAPASAILIQRHPVVRSIWTLASAPMLQHWSILGRLRAVLELEKVSESLGETSHT